MMTHFLNQKLREQSWDFSEVVVRMRFNIFTRQVGVSQVAQWQRICLPMQEMKVLSLGREDTLEEEMETHSVFLPRKSLGQRSRGTTVHRMARVWHSWPCAHAPGRLVSKNPNIKKHHFHNFFGGVHRWKPFVTHLPMGLICLSKKKKSRPTWSVSQFSHSLSRVRLFVTPWTAARQASVSITNSWSLLSSCPLSWWCHPTILCYPLFLPPSIFPSIRVFSNESALCIRYWSFSFNISPSNEYSGLISFRIDWLDLLTVQGTLKCLLQHHSTKASILWCSVFFIVQLSHPYMTWKNHSLD